MLQAIDYLDSVQVALENGGFMEDLVAEDIRSAGRSIDSLLGRIDVEDILGEIFSSFCIGK
jgi:tRNA modification GTPase